MKVTLLCSLLTLTGVLSYEFTDPQFSSLLESEDEHFQREFLSSRTKRETDPDDAEPEGPGPAPEEFPFDRPPPPPGGPPHHGRRGPPGPRGCCGKKPSIHFLDHKNMRDLKGKGANCWQETNEKIGINPADGGTMDFYSCERVQIMKKRHICMSECLAKSMQLAGEDGMVDAAKAKDFMISNAEEDWQKELVIKAVDTCAAKKIAPELQEEGLGCNPHTLFMKHCVYKEVQMQCPEDQQRKDPMCQRLREKMSKETEKES